VPQNYIHDDFRLELLEPVINRMDYEAVMSSRENLRHVFAENDTWPADNMTAEENLNDFIIHEREFKARIAFGYTVLTPDQSKCIGCIYIEPCNRTGFDAEVYFWLRDEIRRNRKPALQILNAGHVIGNHSYTHPRMIFMGAKEVAHQVDNTNAAIRSLGYEGEIFFRPPYGKKLYSLPKHLEKEGITSITWDVEAELGDDIAGYTHENTKSGSIILLHVI
jgi:hypothetical protein